MKPRTRPPRATTVAPDPTSTGTRDSFLEVYDELRALAQSFLMTERPDHTLQATALVHEAYLRLAHQHRGEWKNKSHFIAIASRMIRRILVDHERSRGALRRGGRRGRVALSDDHLITTRSSLSLLELDDALNRLSELSERQARIVELRFFGGLTIDEVAELLAVSPRTVDGEWAMARSWLRSELEGGSGA